MTNQSTLSQKTIKVIENLKYQADSSWSVNILPFGSICWDDEMPGMAELFEKLNDMQIIHGMFAIRIKIWDGEMLEEQERQMWDSVKKQVPELGAFQEAEFIPRTEACTRTSRAAS